MMVLSNPAAPPDRLDDYRALDVLDRASLGPLREVAHDAPAAEKAWAVAAALAGLRAVAHRHPRVVELVAGGPSSP